MSNISSKYITNNIIIFFFIVITAFLSYQYNIFHVTSTKWFSEHQLDSEQLVLDGILNNKDGESFFLGRYSRPNTENQKQEAHNLFNNQNTEGEFNRYTSQYGLQGLFFDFIYNNISKSILFLQSISSIMMSLVVGFLFLLVKRDFSTMGAIIFTSILIFSPWVVVFARNLYWVEALWFIPMVISMYYSKNIFTSSKLNLLVMFILLYFAFLVKFLTGYEYITSIVIASFLPVIYQGLFQNIKKLRIFKFIFMIGLTSILSFSTAIIIHASSIGTYQEGLNKISITAQKRLFKTDNMNDMLNDVCYNNQHCIKTMRKSLEANPLSVAVRYMKINNFLPWIGSIDLNITREQKNHIKEIIHNNNIHSLEKVSMLFNYSVEEFGFTSITLLFDVQKLISELAFLALILIYIIYYKKLTYNDRIFTLLLFTSPFSWYLLMKGHSYIHTHMNYVLWYLPTLPYLVLILYSNYKRHTIIKGKQLQQIPIHKKEILKEKSTKYCVVVPVINEGERIQTQLVKMKDFSKDIDIILADGGSSDGSLDLEFLKSCNVRALLTKQDKGKLSAQLRMAYKFALDEGYEGIVTVDGNGKDSVESIYEFIKKLDEGYDMIQGSRFVPGGAAINTPKIRHFAVKLLHIPAISMMAGFKYTDTTNGFRGYSKRYLEHSEVEPFRDVFDTYELLAYLSVKAPKLGLKTCEVPVTRTYPSDGKVPTKISSLRGNFLLIGILWNLWRKKYDAQFGKNEKI